MPSQHKQTINSLVLAVFLAVVLLLSAFQADDASAAEEMVTLNFVNADIDTVTKAVSQITGKNFVLDPRVKGVINIVSGRPVPKSVIYPFFLSALRMQGFAAVEMNEMVRIMPEVDAKTHAGPVMKPGEAVVGDQVVTKVFGLRYEPAAQLVSVLRPLIAANNSISANPNNNTLVISDYADNLARLTKIIEALDVPRGEEPLVVPLRHASAIELANTLNRLYGEGAAAAGDATQRVTILPDSRTNSVIIRSDNPSKIERLRGLIEGLDQATPAAGNIHVIYLKNAEAVRVAQTLRSIMTGETGSLQSMTPLSPTSNMAGGQTGGAGGLSQAPVSSTIASSGPGAAGGANVAAGGFIQADATHNALIITAPEPVFNNLRRVIDMLDTRRAQVYVEALIVELTSDRASEFGIQWLSLGSNTAVGGTNFGSGGNNIVGLIQNAATAKTTGSLGVSPGLNLGLISGTNSKGLPNLAVLARALETDANANILSAPTLLTLDNEEARIVIGSNVPFITGQYAQTGNTTTATPFQTYDRKDVGLTLKIRPQISEGGVIRLQIFQEASSIQAGTLSNASGPITNKRAIESAVVVDDGGTIVIGGLIEDSYGMGEDKVPLFGDIPVVGNLFRYQTRKRTKTNLMVFLRPKIIRDAEGYQSYTADRYQYILGEQRKGDKDARLMWGEAGVPKLPSPPIPDAPAPAAKQ